MLHGSLFRVSRLHIASGAIVLISLAYYNLAVAGLTAVLFLMLYHRSRVRHMAQQHAFAKYVEDLSFKLDQAAVYALQQLPVAIIVLDVDGIVHWRNLRSVEWFTQEFAAGDNIADIVPELASIKDWEPNQPRIISCRNRYLQLVCSPLEPATNDNQLYAVYASDVSLSEMTRIKSKNAMPVVSYIQIDNLSDVLKGLTEAQRSSIAAEVNTKLAEWAAHTDSYLKRVADDMYVAVFNRRSLEKMLNNKFDILDQIRAIQAGNKIPVTLSIGVAAGETSIPLLGQKAQAGLDLALGRGGDQAAVFAEEKMQFYGGKTKAVEKSTRVKARVVSQAIRELIGDTDLVLIMGHVNEDFDSLGSSVGLAVMARHLNKPTYIVVSQPGAAIDKLSELLSEYQDYLNVFISPAQALELLHNSPNAKPLLFVTDTHRPGLTAAPELLTLVESIVVIDHHRRSEDFIDNSLLVYLEPSASSASELVTELLGYFDESIDMNRLEASALYAGIVVDTKSFAVQTGVRTFDAASYLRRVGADLRLVRQLFSVDFETLRDRSEIIRNASMVIEGIVLSVCPPGLKNIAMIAAQAADMLLNLEGVKASFVIFAVEETINISARSHGDVNVQVLLERFNGGGHQTMAGAQLRDMVIDDVKNDLIKLITQQLKEDASNESNFTTRS